MYQPLKKKKMIMRDTDHTPHDDTTNTMENDNTTTYNTCHSARKIDGHKQLPHFFFSIFEEEQEGKTILILLPLLLKLNKQWD